MKTLRLKGRDGKKFNVSIFDETENPRAIIQFAHGMAEYSARYSDTAEYFNKHGIILAGSDHRGQGYTAEKLGKTDGDSYHDTVDDMGVLTDYLKDTYHLPVIFWGHSYGSFMGQCYIQRYGNKVEAAIFTGSNCMNAPKMVFAGIFCTLKKWLGKGYEDDKWMVGQTFDKYELAFDENERPFAWLSRDKQQVKAFTKDPMSGYIMCINFYASFLFGVHGTYSKRNLKKIPERLPILLLSGDRDPVGEFGEGVKRLYEIYKTIGLKVDMKLYPGARHKILSETNTDEVQRDMLEFVEEVLGFSKSTALS